MKRNPEFTAGLSELVVLRLLSEREMYGYELAKSVQSRARDQIRLGEGLLYPLLHELEVRGLLRSRRALFNGRTRIYYRVSARGKHHLARLLDRWRKASSAVSEVLGEVRHA